MGENSEKGGREQVVQVVASEGSGGFAPVKQPIEQELPPRRSSPKQRRGDVLGSRAPQARPRPASVSDCDPPARGVQVLDDTNQAFVMRNHVDGRPTAHDSLRSATRGPPPSWNRSRVQASETNRNEKAPPIPFILLSIRLYVPFAMRDTVTGSNRRFARGRMGGDLQHLRTPPTAPRVSTRRGSGLLWRGARHADCP